MTTLADLGLFGPNGEAPAEENGPCRQCGCVDEDACSRVEGGQLYACYWVDPTLCSMCAGAGLAWVGEASA